MSHSPLFLFPLLFPPFFSNLASLTDHCNVSGKEEEGENPLEARVNAHFIEEREEYFFFFLAGATSSLCEREIILAANSPNLALARP